jgi:hypothetical protein
MSRLIQDLLAGIAGTLRGMPHCSCAILYRVGKRAARCARSLVRRLADGLFSVLDLLPNLLKLLQ